MWLYFLIAISSNVDLLGGPILLFCPQYGFQLHLFCLPSPLFPRPNLCIYICGCKYKIPPKKRAILIQSYIYIWLN